MSVVIKHDGPDPVSTYSVFKLDEIRDEKVLAAPENAVLPATTPADLSAEPIAFPSLEDHAANDHSQLGIDDTSRLRALNKIVKETVDEVSRMQQQWHADSDRQLLQLAVAIAERIIRGQLERQPSISLQWIRESLELVKGSQRLRICLHPDDCQTLAEPARQIAAEVSRIAEIEVTADVTVSPGGCRVESEHGLVDQCVEAQLQRVVQELECRPDDGC